jgi:chaperonin GroES
MKLNKAVGNNVLVRMSTVSKTPGGLFVPGNAEERFKRGEVLDLGDGQVIGTHNGDVVVSMPKVKVGDVVIFDSNFAVKLEDDVYIVGCKELLAKSV